MDFINNLAVQLGIPNMGITIATVGSIVFAFLLAIIVFIALGVVRNKLGKKSAWSELITVVRQPFTYLVLINTILENLSFFLPLSMDSFLANVESLQSILIILMLIWVLMRYITVIERRLDRRAKSEGAIALPLIGEKIERGTLQILFKILRAVVGIIVLLMIIQAFGVSISGLLAFGGVGGIVVGFAARDVISNTFSGLRIFWSRPFDVGDWIRCASQDIEGVVESIGWQITQVRTFDKRPLYVPNSLLADAVIENPQRMTNRRIYEYFGVRYDDIKKVPEILKQIREMLNEHPHVAKDQKKVAHLDRYGAYSVDFFVYCMTYTVDWMEYHEAKEDILLKIAAIIHDNDADFAFPTETIHVAPSNNSLPHLGPDQVPKVS